MQHNPIVKIPGITRPGRQAPSAEMGGIELAQFSSERLEAAYAAWLANGEPNLPEPDADGFIEWSGAGIPVFPRAVVEIKLRGGFTPKSGYVMGEAFRFDWTWTEGDANDDVIAFRVVGIPGASTPGRQIIDNPSQRERQYLAWAGNGMTAPKLPKAGKDGFVAWSGGDIPVRPDTKVLVRLRGGFEAGGSAFRFDWSHSSAPDDVVAFKVREEGEAA